MKLMEQMERAKSEGPVSEPFAFRLPVEDKARFVQICQEENLSAGKLLRNIVADFIREYEENK